MDYVKNPLELDELDELKSSQGVERLIRDDTREIFGSGVGFFLKEAYEGQEYLKLEIPRRYELIS